MSEIALNLLEYHRMTAEDEDAHRPFSHDVAIVGPSGTGKSTFLNYAAHGIPFRGKPGSSFEEYSIQSAHRMLEIVKIAGCDRYRQWWDGFAGVKCVIVFVHTSDREETRGSGMFLWQARESFPDTPILVVNAKFDVPGSLTTEEIIPFFNLPVLFHGRAWSVTEWSIGAAGFCTQNIFAAIQSLLGSDL